MSAHGCQQDELYAAEGDVPAGRALPDATSLQRYVDDLRDLPYWQRQYSDVHRIEAHVRRDRTSVGFWDARRGCGVVEMIPRHLEELRVLHEVAHALASARYGSRSHDPWYARTYLELVYAALGSETYDALRAAFDRHGVDYATDSSVPAGIVLD